MPDYKYYLNKTPEWCNDEKPTISAEDNFFYFNIIYHGDTDIPVWLGDETLSYDINIHRDILYKTLCSFKKTNILHDFIQH